MENTQVDYLHHDTILRLHIISEGQHRSKTIRYTALNQDNSKLLLYIQKDSLTLPKSGDILLVQTTVKPGEMLGDFDYGQYLRRQGIVGSAWANRQNWQVIGHQPLKGLRATAQRCQRWLHHRYIQMGIHEPELGILSALTLGYREELNSEVQQSFSTAGAMHILAVSGLHTGIVWGLIVWILTLGGLCKPLYEQRIWQRLLTIITLIALWSYAFITGLSPSIMRSALMLTIIEIGWLFQRDSLSINNLSAAAVIILLINPLALWSVSFQLSFAAVASLLTIGNWMQKHIIIHNKVGQYIGGLLIVSLTAQIGTLPLSLHYFGQTSNYFALTNLVVIPAAFILLLLGFGALTMSWCIVGEWLGEAAQWCTYALRLFVQWIEQLPYSTTHINLTATSAGLCHGAIFCAILMLSGERVRWWWLVGVTGCTIGIVLMNR
jgi:competence protein ComEC